MVLKKAIFVDKDGTLVDNSLSVCDSTELSLVEGAREGLHKIISSGYVPIVVTNQPDIALGRFSMKAMFQIEQRIRNLLIKGGIPLAGFYFCPHYHRGKVKEFVARCLCRKPKPGLLFRAARELSIDLENSWFIGDTMDDMEAGRSAGCRTMLLNRGNESQWIISATRNPEFIVDNWREATRTILATPQHAEGVAV